MKNPIESITQFCMIQLEILKEREYRLRKEVQDCQIQREFLSNLLQDVGEFKEFDGDNVMSLIDTIRRTKK